MPILDVEVSKLSLKNAVNLVSPNFLPLTPLLLRLSSSVSSLWPLACVPMVTSSLCSPCRPVSPAAAGCAVGWPWVEAVARSRHLPRPPPRRSSACLKNWTWTTCRSTGPRYAPSATHTVWRQRWITLYRKCTGPVDWTEVCSPTSSTVSSWGVAALSSESFCEPIVISPLFLTSRLFLCLWASFFTWPSALPLLSRRTGLVSHFRRVLPRQQTKHSALSLLQWGASFLKPHFYFMSSISTQWFSGILMSCLRSTV